jgi:hypothetical protein
VAAIPTLATALTTRTLQPLATATQVFVPTSTPPAAATVTPPAVPTASPSTDATDTPPTIEVPTPTPDPDASQLGAETPVFTDDFDDFTSGWTTSADEDATVEYTDGGDNVLYMLFETTEGHSVDSSRELGGEVQTLRLDATVEVVGPGPGAFGLECLDDDWDGVGGGVTTSGAYFLYSRDLIDGRDVIASYNDPPLAGTGVGSQVRLVLECGVDAEGNVETYFSVNGELLLHQTQSQTDVGPLRRVAFYGEAFSGSGTELDWIEASVSADADPHWSPEVEALLVHVPAEIADGCSPANTDGADGVVAGVACNAMGPDGSFISVFYEEYETEAKMQRAHADARAESGDGATDGGECVDGDPGTGTWSIGGETVGQYLCYMSFGTPTLNWTYTDLRILAEASNTDSDSADGFDELWRWWEEAGPI